MYNSRLEAGASASAAGLQWNSQDAIVGINSWREFP